MLRTVVTIYLSLATLAGPAVCCCSVFRFATPASAAHPVRPPSNDESGGCPHCHKHAAPTPPDTPTKEPDRPRSPDCPCRSHAAQPAVPQAEAELGVVLTSVLSFADLVPAEIAATWIAVAPDLLPASQLALLPFLTAQDLLRAHHLLRC